MLTSIRTQDDIDCARAIARIALSFLSGSIEPVEAARGISGLRGEFLIGVPIVNEALSFLWGVDSETDALPLGEVRLNWNPAALAAKDIEIEAANNKLRARVEAACRTLIWYLQPDERDLCQEGPAPAVR